MSVAAVVCEFNPFHNGHRYLLDNIQSDYKLCIMSGNFVQRGEIAICDKYLRAEEAVRNGADLVIELPLPYAVAPAESFARGSISLLDKLEIIDNLYFGAESPLCEIEEFIKKTETDAFKTELKKLLDSGISYPDAVSSAGGDNRICSPNNILAIEYIKQLKRLNSRTIPVAVRRVGTEHDSQDTASQYASASYIREKIKNGDEVGLFIPTQIRNSEVADFRRIETAALYRLRLMNENDYSEIADVTEGLEYRIKKAIGECKSIAEAESLIKTKRYTQSKIRRIILSAFLGIKKEMQETIPDYINVLACNQKGTELIKMIKEKSEITPVIRYSDTEALNETDKKLYEFTVMCDDIFGQALPESRNTGYDKTRKFRVI